MASSARRTSGPATFPLGTWVVSLGVFLSTSVAVVLGTAAPADAGIYENTGQCVEGTFYIRHGVTAVQVTAIGAAGEDGQDVTQNQFGATVDWQGGTGGLGSRVETTIPVTYGMTLYVGVANSGMPGGGRSDDNRGGQGGAASWVTTTDPRVNGECKPKQADVLVVGAGGGGGGSAGNRTQAHPGGAGGVEASGGDGGRGAQASALFDSPETAGYGGRYSNGSSGGAGGAPGSSPGCTGGKAGAAGATVAGGGGGAAGVPTFGSYDCSNPPPGCYACNFSGGLYGGSGGGGGGGLWGGGGGGGADSSGFGAGGGGASGRSYARSPISYTVASTRTPAVVRIEAITTPAAITSGNAATFTRGTFGSTLATATGVDTPFVRFKGTMPSGVTNNSATFPDDGSGAGSATLSGTPNQHGVFPLTVEACNSVGCTNQPFTLTVNGSPSFTSHDTNVFVIGSAGSHPITTSAYPAAAITQTGAPAWLTLTDHGDGTATLAGTPPAGAAGTVTVNLTAANGIGTNATQTLTLKVVTALSITPSTVHLVPGSGHPSFDPYRRGFQQQLQAIGTFSDGSTGDLTGFVRWSSSDADVASVTSGALVRAHALGTATITAGTAVAADPTATIIVAMPLSIEVLPASVSLMGGESQQFTAIGCYATPCTGANVFDISKNVRWFTTNFDASITADGLATANHGGASVAVMAELHAALSGLPSVRGEADITITHGDVVQVVVSPDGITVPTRTTVRYKARLVYEDGTLAHDSPFVTWSVSGIPTATIGFGDAYSPDPGTLTVTASFANAGGSIVHGNATLNVIRTPSTLIVQPVSGSSLTPLVKGGTRQYQALARYTDGTPDLDVTNGVEWVSTEPADVTMSASGLATAKASAEGETATVFARYTYDNGFGSTSQLTGNSVVTVTLLPPMSIAITPVDPAVLHPGDDLQFTATGTYADGSTVDLTRAIKDVDEDGHATYHVMWQSSNTFVGVLNSSGSLHIPSTGPTQGTVTVSASIIGPSGVVLHSNDVVVTVTDPLERIHLHSRDPAGSPQFITAGVSTAYPYWVEGFDARGHSLGDVTDRSVISMSPDGVCDPVLLTCRATVADIGSNRHTISAYNPDAVQPTSNAIQILILRAATQRVEITGGSLEIVAGQSTAPYQVTGYDAFDNEFNATNITSFSISPVETTSGCTGGPAGSSPTCHAVTAGAHTVRASTQSGAFVNFLPLWVHPSPVLDHLTLSGGSSAVPLGATTQPYVVTGYDAYGNNGVITNQTVLEISPDGTCDNTAFTCTPASAGPHSVIAKHVNDGMASNTLPLNGVAPPTLAVSFTPTAVVKGSIVDLRFTVTNPNTVALTGIGWTATIPPSLVATSLTNNTCNNPGFVFSLPPSGFVMSGVTLNAGASCTFTYRAQATAAGGFSSTMSGLTSANGGSSAQTATATLDVTGPPLLTKSFVAGSVTIGSTTPLTFTVTNPNTSLTLTGIGFHDVLPAGLSFAGTTVTGSCGGAVFTIQGSTLYVGPNGANGAIGSGAHGATLPPGGSCTFSTDVVADTLGTKVNTTANVTSTERGTGAQATATVVVSPPVDHFDIELDALTAGTPGSLRVTARDRFNNVMTDYDGQPTLTGDFTASDTGCGTDDTAPCVPTYSMPPFVNGVGEAVVTAYRVEFSRSVTVTDGLVVSPSSAGLLVNPGSFDHITLEGGSTFIPAGDFTLPYSARGWDRYGNLRGNAAFTLSITPNGTCGVDSCTTQVSDADGSHHNVIATNVAALHPTATRSLIVGHGPIGRITLDGGNRTLVAGGTTQPYTIYGYDAYDNEIGIVPAADLTLTMTPNGTCDQVVRTCTVTVADAPGQYHMVEASHVDGPRALGDQLVVSAGPLHHLVLTPDTSSVDPEQFQAYVAAGYDAFGNALGDRTAQATFTIAGGTCIDSSCHATSAGAHTVTATLGTATGTATLNVGVGPLHTIALTGGSASIVTGSDTAPYVVVGYDAGGNSLGDVTDGATLSINPDGTCDQTAHTCTATTPDNGGFHVVTATHPGAIGGPTANANLVVTDVPIDHIALTGGSPTITAGGSTAPYVVTAYDADNNALGDVTSDVTFSIAPDGTCAQSAHTCSATVVDTGGSHHTVTATHPTATSPTATSDVVVTAGGGGGGTPGALDHFVIDVRDLDPGEWGLFTVTAYDAAGVKTDYVGTPTITGTLGASDSACGPTGQDPCPPDYFLGAFVDGVAFAQVRGFRADAGRTVSVTDGAVVSTSNPFTIRPGLLDHVDLSGGSAVVGTGEDTAPYVVTGYDAFGNEVGDVTSQSTFSILPFGTCTGAVCSSTFVGPHLVRSDTNGLTATQDLLVQAGPIAAMFLVGDPFVMAGSPTSPYRVDGFDAAGNYVADVTAEVTLSITPDGSCDSTTYTCSATAADAPGGGHVVTATHPTYPPAIAELTVLPGLVDDLVLSPDEATIAAGGSQAFTARLVDAFGNVIADVTPDTSFEVADDPCTGATCGSTVAGDQVVSGTFKGLGDTATLHVNAGPLDHVTLTGGSTSVEAGTATAPYQVEGWDAYDNDLGDVTDDSPLSIAPDGTCDQVAHTCTPASDGPHVVTATNGAATDPTDTKSLTVTAPPVVAADVRLTKTGPATAVPGTNVTYLLTARNLGPGAATGVEVSDPFPAGTSFVSETHPAGWSCTTAGAYTCTRASLSTADGAQLFTLVLHLAASATGPVSNTAVVTATSSDNAPGNNTPPAVVTQVGCAQAITGLYAGDLTLSGPGTTCLRNVTVTGKLTVVKGATLVAVNAVIGGAMSANGSGAITFCDSTLRSSVSISGARGFVLFGDPGDDGCAGNTVTGSLSVSGGLAGLNVRSNVLRSSLTVDKNKGGGPFPVDANPIVAGNRISGRLGCKGNTPAPINAGQPNVAPSKSGQCAGL